MPSPAGPALPTTRPAIPTQPPGRNRRLLALVAGGVALLLLVGGIITWAVWPSPPDDGRGGPSHGAQPPASPACGFKIAVLGVLTGSNNGDGVAVRDSTKLAVEQYNAKHPGCTATLVEYDSQNTAADKDDQAGAQARAIVADNSILGVVGPIYASEVHDALPVLESGGIPVITPSATDTDLSQNGWKVFHRTLGTDTDQALAGARYLKQVLHASRTYVVDDGSSFGSSVASQVDRQLGTGSVGTATLDSNATDYTSITKQVVTAGADAVYYGGLSRVGGAFVKQMRAANPNITIVAGDRVFTDSFVDAAGKQAAEGVYITCPCVPPSEARNNYAEQFKTRYANSPGYYGPEGFDAANVLLAGLNAGKATRADMLAWVNGYDGEGISRHVKFTPKGDLDGNKLQVWIYKVSNGDVKSQSVIPEA